MIHPIPNGLHTAVASRSTGMSEEAGERPFADFLAGGDAAARNSGDGNEAQHGAGLAAAAVAVPTTPRRTTRTLP